jgi:hypothetical protein
MFGSSPPAAGSLSASMQRPDLSTEDLTNEHSRGCFDGHRDAAIPRKHTSTTTTISARVAASTNQNSRAPLSFDREATDRSERRRPRKKNRYRGGAELSCSELSCSASSAPKREPSSERCSRFRVDIMTRPALASGRYLPCRLENGQAHAPQSKLLIPA